MTTPTWFWWLANKQGNPLTTPVGPVDERRGYLTNWVALSVYVCCLAAFIADMTSINTLAFGVFYVPLVATAALYKGRNVVWLLAFLGCAMVIIGTFIPSFHPDQTGLVLNRTLSICALLTTAAFVWRSRLFQDQLSEQSTRTNVAESARSEALANLCQEIRPRLHTVFGVLQFMEETGQTRHVTGCGLLRNTARCLLMTVENLIDLLQWKDKQLPVEQIDLGQVLSQTVASFQCDTQMSRLTLTIDTSHGIDAFVLANPWALRRILENQLGDAISNGKPGDHIVIRTSVEQGHSVVSITKTTEQSPSVSRFMNEFQFSPSLPVTNQAFNQRLALAMNARLVLARSCTEGTASHLVLAVPGHYGE